MGLKFQEAFRDPDLARVLVDKISAQVTGPLRLMEVCGTHTVALFRAGIRSLLPDTIALISGPGCPVCVTAQGEIDAFVALSRRKGTIVTTFGDLMRVPGSQSSLRQEKARGADVRVVYSTMDAVTCARENPNKEVVFLGVGFETTAPTVAAAVHMANQMGLGNFSVMTAHKIVPPALEVLMSVPKIQVNGFILPGHVSAIIGRSGYRGFFDHHQVPCAIAGFEPLDLLRAIYELVKMVTTQTPKLVNCYERVVSETGNPMALKLLERIFKVAEATWRGIGPIPNSGLVIRKAFRRFDAYARFGIELTQVKDPAGCACGEILTGSKVPPQCKLYKTKCTPLHPIGPCMVSTEGTCAAYYRYYDDPVD